MEIAAIEKSKDHKDKLYESIVDSVKKMYGGKLSETEAHAAARNLIEFYKVLLE